MKLMVLSLFLSIFYKTNFFFLQNNNKIKIFINFHPQTKQKIEPRNFSWNNKEAQITWTANIKSSIRKHKIHIWRSSHPRCCCWWYAVVVGWNNELKSCYNVISQQLIEGKKITGERERAELNETNRHAD